MMNPDDFEVGIYVTILEREKVAVPVVQGGEGIIPSIVQVENPSLGGIGSVFQIKAVDLPFVAISPVEKQEKPKMQNPSMTFLVSMFEEAEKAMSGEDDVPVIGADTRRIKFKKLSAEYVKAMTGLDVKPDEAPEPTDWMKEAMEEGEGE